MIYLALTVAMPCTGPSHRSGRGHAASAGDAVATVLQAMTGTISAIVPWPAEIRSTSVDAGRSREMPYPTGRQADT